MTLDRSTVLASLRVEDVVAHFQIPGRWRGRWLRSRRCPTNDHDTDAFGIATDGHWHCHACSTGGDLLRLIAASSKLDMQRDFPRVLEIAAEIAGVQEDTFGSPPPKPQRPPIAALPPLPERVALAKRRAAWVWDRLVRRDEFPRSAADGYLQHERGLDPVVLRDREQLRETPLRVMPKEISRLMQRGDADRRSEMDRMVGSFSVPGVALPVRAVDDGALVDIRIRRFDPRDGQPKIVGMLGGVTVGGAEQGGVPQLVGCYGHPECIDPGFPGTHGLVVVCEGAMDYLSALVLWTEAQSLAAVDAGSISLVARHVASQLATYPGSRMLIVEQNDPPGVRKDGTPRLGRADETVNEEANAACKVAIRILGPARVSVLRVVEYGAYKDLNDLVRAGISIGEQR